MPFINKINKNEITPYTKTKRGFHCKANNKHPSTHIASKLQKYFLEPGCGFFVLQWNPLFVFDLLFPLWSTHSLACDHLTRPWSRSFSSLRKKAIFTILIHYTKRQVIIIHSQLERSCSLTNIFSFECASNDRYI